MKGELNPEMFRLARDSRGFTQEELAESSGVAQGTISKLELGLKEIADDALGRIAQALQYPVSFFAQQEKYTGLGISVIFYRKRASTLQKHIRRLQATINILRLQAKSLLRDVSLKTPYDIRTFDITEYPGTPEDIAAIVRASWNVPAGPIHNLVESIENAGGVVFRFPFGTSDIDAISQWPVDTPPLFFVNSQAPADRARFSLAHELGHIIMHQDVSDTMEQDANQFAAALLAPQQDIRPQLADGGITLQKAAALKPYWRVSMAFLIKRARDLECIGEHKYQSLFVHYTRLGYKRSEPFPIAHEEPQLILQITKAHMQQGRFSDDEMASMVNLTVEEFRQKYPPHTPGALRIAL